MSSRERSSGLRAERIKACDRFSGTTFRNTRPIAPGLKKGTVIPTLSEYLCGGQRRAPAAPLPVLNPLASWARAPQTGLRATWLGHSTVLVEIDGVRLLTDPVFGERASPVSFAGPKRFHPVPAPISALPALDAVLLSHDHYDHLDRASIIELTRLGVPIITSLGVGAHLEGWGIPPEKIRELDWWEHTEIANGVVVTAAPSQHFSGRSAFDRNKTAWSSLHVRGPKHAFFFSGDTGLTEDYSLIASRLGAVDLVMLEVGAFHPAWGDIHLGPENALKAHAMLGGGAFLPVHWGTFNLAIHAWDEPPETLLELAPSFDAQLLMPRLGEVVEPAQVERVDPWWRNVAKEERALPAAALAEPTELDPSVPWPID